MVWLTLLLQQEHFAAERSDPITTICPSLKTSYSAAAFQSVKIGTCIVRRHTTYDTRVQSRITFYTCKGLLNLLNLSAH